jgi:predicted kinase
MSEMQSWQDGPVRQLLLREAKQHLSRGRQFIEQAGRAKPADVPMLLDLGEAFLVTAAELLTEVASGRRAPADGGPAA